MGSSKNLEIGECFYTKLNRLPKSIQECINLSGLSMSPMEPIR